MSKTESQTTTDSIEFSTGSSLDARDIFCEH